MYTKEVEPAASDPPKIILQTRVPGAVVVVRVIEMTSQKNL